MPALVHCILCAAPIQASCAAGTRPSRAPTRRHRPAAGSGSSRSGAASCGPPPRSCRRCAISRPLARSTSLRSLSAGAHGVEFVAHRLQAARLLLQHVEHRAFELLAVRARRRARSRRGRRRRRRRAAVGAGSRRSWPAAPRGPAASARAWAILRSQSARRSAARRSSIAFMASMRSVQQSNQAGSVRCRAPAGRRRAGDAAQALQFGQSAPPAGCARQTLAERRAPANSANTWKQRSCEAIRCSHCCWRALSLRPAAKAAAPQARSWPANSLPCMKLNRADQQARDLRVGRAVGRLEHDGQQAGDQLGEGGGRLRRHRSPARRCAGAARAGRPAPAAPRRCG